MFKVICTSKLWPMKKEKIANNVYHTVGLDYSKTFKRKTKKLYQSKTTLLKNWLSAASWDIIFYLGSHKSCKSFIIEFQKYIGDKFVTFMEIKETDISSYIDLKIKKEELKKMLESEFCYLCNVCLDCSPAGCNECPDYMNMFERKGK